MQKRLYDRTLELPGPAQFLQVGRELVGQGSCHVLRA